jgi:hypothetical protein
MAENLSHRSFLYGTAPVSMHARGGPFADQTSRHSRYQCTSGKNALAREGVRASKLQTRDADVLMNNKHVCINRLS